MYESIGHRPLWGRCPAPSLNLNHNLRGQGTGTADHLTLLRLFSILSSQLLPEYLQLHHCPCPPARDWGSRVSGLVSYCFGFAFVVIFCLLVYFFGQFFFGNAVKNGETRPNTWQVAWRWERAGEGRLNKHRGKGSDVKSAHTQCMGRNQRRGYTMRLEMVDFEGGTGTER